MTQTAQQIARTVAPLIETPCTFQRSERHVCDIGHIRTPAGTIILRPGYGARANRIDASYSLSGMREAFGTVAPWPRQPECSFAMDRSPDAIARDIQRKLIDAAQPLIAQITDKLAQQASADRDASAARDQWLDVPGLRIGEYKPGNYETDWRLTGCDNYARGKIRAETVSFDYIGSVSHDKARRIIAILQETE